MLTTISTSPAIAPLHQYRETIPWLVKLGPPRFRRFLLGLIPSRRVKRLVHVVDVLDEAPKRIIREKKRVIAEGREGATTGGGKDLLSILCKLSLDLCLRVTDMFISVRANTEAPEEERISDDELAAQMSYVSTQSPFLEWIDMSRAGRSYLPPRTQLRAHWRAR